MDKNQPIIKKITKRHHEGHHGGSWKVAYADFVTAMMAFFLLMWLLNSTTEKQKKHLSDFFENPTIFLQQKKKESGSASLIDFGKRGHSNESLTIENFSSDQESHQGIELSNETLDKLLQEREQQKLFELKQSIEKAIESSLILSNFKEQLNLDITNEGLRIQVIDQENRPMFDIGSAHLTEYADEILAEISELLQQVPNRISISGHTDLTPYSDSHTNYSNWELSSDRANSARRTFVNAGMSIDKIGRVIGLASSVLHDETDPYSPVNRRISIVVLNKKTTQSIGLDKIKSQMESEPDNSTNTEVEIPGNILPLW